jgi:hypothetical protein
MRLVAVVGDVSHSVFVQGQALSDAASAQPNFRPDKYRHSRARITAMDTQEELDDLTEEGDEVIDYRARARAEIDQIARLAKNALAEHAIDLTVFFLVQSNGPILTFGTMSEPSENQWEQVSKIVLSIVREVTGLDGAWCRRVMCASTDAVADNEHSPILTPTLQHTGADQ